jgi:hypothetical protein
MASRGKHIEGRSKLLTGASPLQVLPDLALALGLNEAIALQQVHYWTQDREPDAEGLRWTHNSYSEWQEQFPWWSLDTIKRTFHSLEQKGVLHSRRAGLSNLDRTKAYAVNHEAVRQALGALPKRADCPTRRGQDAPTEEGKMPHSNGADCTHRTVQNAPTEEGKMPHSNGADCTHRTVQNAPLAYKVGFTETSTETSTETASESSDQLPQQSVEDSTPAEGREKTYPPTTTTAQSVTLQHQVPAQPLESGLTAEQIAEARPFVAMLRSLKGYRPVRDPGTPALCGDGHWYHDLCRRFPLLDVLSKAKACIAYAEAEASDEGCNWRHARSRIEGWLEREEERRRHDERERQSVPERPLTTEDLHRLEFIERCERRDFEKRGLPVLNANNRWGADIGFTLPKGALRP